MSIELENKFNDVIRKYYKDKKYIPSLEYILNMNDDLYISNQKYISNKQYIEKVYKLLYNKLVLKYNKKLKHSIEGAIDLKLRSYQEEYVEEALYELCNNSRCLLDAPTGSGKTKMAFVIQSKLIKSNARMIYVFVSPLLRINEQCLKDSYIYYNTNFNTSNNLNNFEEIQVNSTNTKCFKYIVDVINDTNKNILLSTTYQSIKYIFKLGIDIDLLILDEAHCIPSYVHSKIYFEKLDTDNDYRLTSEEVDEIKQTKTSLKKREWYNIFFNEKVKQRLFLTATPYDYQITDTEKYGKHINKIKIGELIESNTLSEIKTYIASVNDRVNINKSDYDRPDTAISIMTFIKNTNRYRLCIFVNNKQNAKKLKDWILKCPLYKSFKQDTGLELKEPILYLSGEDTQITDFSNNETNDTFNDKEVRIIISCKKLSMGIDIPCIDSIVFADPRINTADISQCIGRGLRFFNYGDNIKTCCILLIKYIRDEYIERNKMIFEYLDYLKKNNIFNHIRKIPKEKCINPNLNPNPNRDPNRDPDSKLDFDNRLIELNIYDGYLDLDLEYYEEYSKHRYNEDKKYINEDLLEYNNRKEEYDTIKLVCIKYNINTIDDYLKMIANFKDKNINKLTNPEVYFTDLKLPKDKPKIWKCWYVLFGRDISKMPITYDDWKVKVEELNLYSTEKYYSYCVLNDDMPYYPKLLYNNIPDLHNILDVIFE